MQTQSDMMVLHYVAQILRQVVPLMEHPSEAFLAAVEEDLVKLIMRHGQMVGRRARLCVYTFARMHTVYSSVFKHTVRTCTFYRHMV